jgi:hypothetical protein
MGMEITLNTLRFAYVHLSNHRLAWSAVAVFLLVSIPLTFGVSDELSGWNLMTNSVNGSGLSLAGYTYLMNGTLVHRENTPFLLQAIMYAGAPAPLDYYAMRGFYAFLASLLSPLVGFMNAFLLVNYAAWAICVWTAWHFTAVLFDSRVAAWLAALFATAGIGMTAHIRDYSAHLLAYAFYFLGVYVIYTSRVWMTARPLRVHVALGLFLAVAALNYNNGLMLLAGYVLVAFRRNRWFHLVIGALIALTAQPLGVRFINLLDGLINGGDNWLFYQTIESRFLVKSLYEMKAILSQGLGLFILQILRYVVEFTLFLSPAVVAAGLLGLRALPGKNERRNWFMFVFISVPLGAVLPFAGSAAARGYLTYGMMILWVALAAGFLTNFYRKGGWARAAAAAAGLLVVVGHLWWGFGHLGWQLGPLKAYYLGFGSDANENLDLLFQKPEIMTMTGGEPLPAAFGGTASLAAAGFAEAPPPVTISPRFEYALLARLFYSLYVVLLTVSILPAPRQRWMAAAGLVGALVVLAGLATRISERPAYAYPVIELPPGGTLTYDLQVSPTFVERLAETMQPEDVIVLNVSGYYGGLNGIAYRALVDGEPVALDTVLVLPITNYRMAVRDSGAFLDALRRSSAIRLEMRNESAESVLLSGWQKNALMGRVLQTGRPAPVLPYFEILVSRDQFTPLIGY